MLIVAMLSAVRDHHCFLECIQSKWFSQLLLKVV